MTHSIQAIRTRIRSFASVSTAKAAARFHKTGPGEYAEGDQFLGVNVPSQRGIVRQHRALPLSETRKLLQSTVHEDRAVALLILVWQYPRAGERMQRGMKLRIGFSVAVFLLLLLAWATGLIEPHGLGE